MRRLLTTIVFVALLAISAVGIGATCPFGEVEQCYYTSSGVICRCVPKSESDRIVEPAPARPKPDATMGRDVNTGRRLGGRLTLGGIKGGGEGEKKVASPILAQPVARARVELWRNVSVPPASPWTGPRAHVITYVLPGNVGGETYTGSNQQIIEARANLEALVDEIRSFESYGDVPAERVVSANVFCIPSFVASSPDRSW
jgi:hypothetical protein